MGDDAAGRGAFRAYGVVGNSSVDGPGMRYALFAQGCPRRCPGCHNPDSQTFSGGDEVRPEDVVAGIARDPLVSGLSLSGGEPFSQAEALCAVVDAVRDAFPGLDVWAWSGWTFEELAASGDGRRELLGRVDVLVDGPFVEGLRDPALPWRGSSNQRIVDVAASLAAGEAIVIDDGRWRPRGPAFEIRDHSRD